MSIVTGKEQVLSIYREAEKNHWTLPCFCTENLTTTEAILGATLEHGRRIGIDDLPVIIAITNNYDHRPQTHHYTHTKQWDIGLRLFLADLEVLVGKGSPYERLRVMVHLDHVQHDTDAELLTWDMSQFSSIMFDASTLPFEDNIMATNAFVRERGNEIVVEGACDEIVDATGKARNELTSAEKAQVYHAGTGVDLIVANLGTEHRASMAELVYRGDLARQIRDRIGSRIVLHGASSVPPERISSLCDDGVCKVNLWTTLERDSSPALLEAMVRNASGVAGEKPVQKLKSDGFLGPACALDRANIEFYTTVFRQDVVYDSMKGIVRDYLRRWYK